MRARDTAWIDLADKRRPAIVLEVQDGWARVAYGTRETRAWPSVTVHPSTRAGRAFPLSEVTYFYGANTAWELLPTLQPGQRPAPLELLLEVRTVVETYDASLVTISSEVSEGSPLADAEPAGAVEDGSDVDQS